MIWEVLIVSDAVSLTIKMLENGEIGEQDCKTLWKTLESKGFNAVSSSKKVRPALSLSYV